MMDDSGRSASGGRAPGGRDLSELRRIAFGRTLSADDERAAAEARRELEQLESALPDESTPLEASTSLAHDAKPVEPEPSTQELTGADGTAPAPGDTVFAVATTGGQPPGPRQPWGRKRWLLVVAAAFLVGAVASAAFTTTTRPTTVRFVPTSSDGSGTDNRTQPTSTGAPFTVTTPDPLDANGDGFVDGNVGSYTDDYTGTIAASSLRASEKWFSREQTEDDRTTIKFAGVVPNSIRLMHTDSDGLRYWIARNDDDDFCLLTAMNGPGNVSMVCTTTADFIVSGLTVDTVDSTTGANRGSVDWNAHAFTISSTSTAASAEKSATTGGGKTTG